VNSDYDFFNPTDVPAALYLQKVQSIARKEGILHVMFKYLPPRERDAIYTTIEEANPPNDYAAKREAPRENSQTP
jgi:hypothetical protein